MNNLHSIAFSSAQNIHRQKNVELYRQAETSPIKQSLATIQNHLDRELTYQKAATYDLFRLNFHTVTSKLSQDASLAMTKKTELILDLDLMEGSEGDCLLFLKSALKIIKWIRIGPLFIKQFGYAFLKKCANLGFLIFLDLELSPQSFFESPLIQGIKGFEVEFLSYMLETKEDLQKAVSIHKKMALEAGIIVSIKTTEVKKSPMGLDSSVGAYKELVKIANTIPEIKGLCLPFDCILSGDQVTKKFIITNEPSYSISKGIEREIFSIDNLSGLKRAHFIILGHSIFFNPHSSPLEMLDQASKYFTL